MDTEITVVGAGVVGLAVAAELSHAGRDVFLLEQYAAFGQETSSRNSEVIHAGIYYPPGTLKASLCVKGASLLYDICKKHHIPHCPIGKLIVAVNKTEVASLETLKINGEANGVTGLRMLTAKEALDREPNVRVEAGLWSPCTGIIDAHCLMKYYEACAVKNKVSPVYSCTVTGIQKISGGYGISFTDREGQGSLTCEIVVNCAGLSSDKVAAMAGMDIAGHDLALKFCKGEYFSVKPAKARLVNGLVYPSPLSELTGLGIHATKDLGNKLKLGPNAFYVDARDYEVNGSHAAEFLDSVNPFLPFLDIQDLSPDMAGIRPKLQGPGQKSRDFYIKEESDKGLPGFINLIGIESPGLTSSPAIAKMVAGMLG